MPVAPLNVLWMIDHVCYDGSLHGGGRLFWNILSQFDPAKVRVVPCILRANETLRSLFKDAPIPVRILDKGKFDPTTLTAVLDIIKEENIDVMHLHCYASSTFGRLAGLLTGVPTIIHDYDTEVYFPYPSYLKLADWLLAPMTQGAVAASPMVKHFLMHKRKIDERKIRMMFHAVPDEKFQTAKDDSTAKHDSLRVKARLGIKEQTRVMGTVTKLGPQRGNELLIEAFSKVAIARPNSALVLLYKLTRFHRLPSKKYVEVAQSDLDNAVDRLRSLAQKLGVADKVHLVEWPDDIDSWADTFDVFVAPFLSDRFSSVYLIEAMAKQQPVVATNLGEAKEIVQNGKNGYLVPPGDAQALADAVLAIMQSDESLAAFSAQARRDATKYSVSAYVRSLQNWYTELALADAQTQPSLAEVTK